MHRNHREKRNTWQRLALAVLLALTLGLATAAPVAASPDIENVSVTVTTPAAGVGSEYIINFTPNVGLNTTGNVIMIQFPPGTTVPGIIATADVTVEDLDSLSPLEIGAASQVVVSGNNVTIWLPAGVTLDFQHRAEVTFVGPPGGAGIVNPSAAGNYTIWVWTDEEPTPVSASYSILAGPVDIYLKWQMPLEESGYITYEFVSSFLTITEALEYADAIWMGQTPWIPGPPPRWNLYTGPPLPGSPGYFVGVRIVVSPGTYNETFEIDTPGIELVSAGGAAVTIIDGAGLPPVGPVASIGTAPLPLGAVVYISSGGVTFDGFTVINGGAGLVTIGPNDADSNGLVDTSGIWVEPTSVKCLGDPLAEPPLLPSVVDPSAPGGPGAYLCEEARVNVLNNIVHDNQADGIRAINVSILVSGNEVYDNRWDGFYGERLIIGVETIDPLALTSGTTAYSEINMNEFYTNGTYAGGSNMGDGYTGWTNAGIDIFSTATSASHPTMTGLYIVGNNIHDNQHAGIHLQDGATGPGQTSDMVIIKFNQITDNGVFGISTKADYPEDITCVYNNISGNPDWGIKNWQIGSFLVASMNWWGHLSGPSAGDPPEHPGIGTDQTAWPDALGQGDAVSHYVIYQWWLTLPFEDVQTDLIRYYGSDRYQGIDNSQFDPPWDEIIPLSEGWNTLSTPALLDSRADQMGEIVALGGWMQNWVIAYSYDPVSGWQQVLTDFRLMPLEAIYIRMSASDYVPILLSSSNYQPTRDLGPGWNLVSLNAGFWSQEIQYMGVGEALAPISGSWSTAISPIMPGQQVNWVVTSNNIGSEDMYIGDGYWVFTTEATTLAGFRMAPWYLDEWEMDLLDCGPLNVFPQ